MSLEISRQSSSKAPTIMSSDHKKADPFTATPSSPAPTKSALHFVRHGDAVIVADKDENLCL